MFASNASLRSSRLNPLPLRQAHNFAFLGEDIGGLELNNSLSLATAVAAGVVGSLLDFMRQPICQNLRNSPKSIADVSSILHLMSVSDGGYDCVFPWKVLNAESISPLGSSNRAWIRLQLAALFSNVSNDLSIKQSLAD